MIFRACIGPSASRVHIYVQGGSALTLCCKTAKVREVTGNVNHQVICMECIKVMATMLKQERDKGEAISLCDTPAALAQTLGLEAIV
jgi:hypothetical protein